MDEMITEKFVHMNEIMDKIGPAFDKCSNVEHKEMYPNINMLHLLSEAQTALEAVLFSLKREYLTLIAEKERKEMQEKLNKEIDAVPGHYIT